MTARNTMETCNNSLDDDSDRENRLLASTLVNETGRPSVIQSIKGVTTHFK